MSNVHRTVDILLPLAVELRITKSKAGSSAPTVVPFSGVPRIFLCSQLAVMQAGIRPERDKMSKDKATRAERLSCLTTFR